MSEHLKIARDGGSYTLQRRLLSAVMGEVVSVAGIHSYIASSASVAPPWMNYPSVMFDWLGEFPPSFTLTLLHPTTFIHKPPSTPTLDDPPHL